MAMLPESLADAIACHRAGQFERAEQAYRQILQADPGHARAHYLLGVLHDAVGKLDEAIAELRRAAALQPQLVEARNHLGVLLTRQGKLPEAIACFRQAIELRPEFRDAHLNLRRALGASDTGGMPSAAASTALPTPASTAVPGRFPPQRFDPGAVAPPQMPPGQPDEAERLCAAATALREQGKPHEAAAHYQRAIRLKPGLAQAHNGLGIAWVQLGKLTEAVASFRRGVEIMPGLAVGHCNLGNALKEQGHLGEAIHCYRQALRVQPDLALAYSNLGGALCDQRKLDEALACCQRALELNPNDASAYCNLGYVFKEQNQLDQAEDSFQRAIAIRPGFPLVYSNLGKVFQARGKMQQAADCYRKILQFTPQQWLWELRAAALCPTIFGSNDEIQHYRDRLAADLQRFQTRELRVDPGELGTLGCEPSFNLQFHGRNDRAIKEAHAKLFRSLTPAAGARPGSGTPRIGFVVTKTHERLFLRCLGGMLERLDPRLFELVIVCCAERAEIMRSGLHSESIGILPLPERLDQVIAVVREARFDLLYYWEIGTDATNYLLPFFRTAPVQCTSFGIVVTSGIPQVDYYLSSALVEGEDAASHYTEQLILANTLLPYQRRAALPEPAKKREDFGLRTDQHLYLCAQQLGKFHPDFDALLAEILRRDAQGVIVITEDRYGYDLQKLRRRFATAMPDVVERIIFVPYQPLAGYLSLIATAEVLLDPVHFGAGATAYDGFSLGKATVTWPSPFQRGRFVLGCYKKMGIASCVAADPQQYVEIAVALGTDASFRAEVGAQIRQASPVLFEDAESIREHQRIFQTLIEEARCRGD